MVEEMGRKTQVPKAQNLGTIFNQVWWRTDFAAIINVEGHLRHAVCNERWRETWQKAVLQYRKLQALHRKTRLEQRKLALLAAANPSQVSSKPASLPVSSPLQPVSLDSSLPVLQSSPSTVPAATLPGSSRPSPHHPWKRGPSCSPKTFAKI
jgi:hypothetical protein